MLALWAGSAGGAAAQSDSLSLEAALATGRSRSPVVAEATAGVRAAEGGLAIARSAARPTATTDAGFIRYQDPPAISAGALGAFDVLGTNTYYGGVRAEQPVFTSGRLTGLREAAHATVEAAEWARAQADVELTAAIARAYYDALLAEALTHVADQSVTVLRRARDVAEAHYAEGTVARLDVLRAESSVSEAGAALRAARDAAVGARERLAVTIGVAPQQVPPLRDRLDPGPGASNVPDTIPLAALLDERPDLRALEARAAAERARAVAARAGGRPTVGVFAAGYAITPEPLAADDGWGLEVLAGVSVSWPFLDGGRARGREAAARARAEGTDARLEQSRLSAVAGTRAVRRDLRRARVDIEAATADVSRAERALGIAEDRYASGVGIQLDVLEAETALTRARTARLRAIHAYRTALIQLKRTLGIPADATIPGPGER